MSIHMTKAQLRTLQRERDSEAAATEAMVEAMRCMGFEAVCQTFIGHLMGRPDATSEHKHQALQEMARIAWQEIEAR